MNCQCIQDGDVCGYHYALMDKWIKERVMDERKRCLVIAEEIASIGFDNMEGSDLEEFCRWEGQFVAGKIIAERIKKGVLR